MKQNALVNFIYEKSQAIPPGVALNLHLATGGDGEISVSLPNPAPAHLWIQVQLKPDNWRCTCYALVVNDEVMHNGLLPAHSVKGAAGVDRHPRQGEILFTARPATFYERVLQPLLRE